MNIWVSRKNKDELCVGIDRVIDDNADRSKCTFQCAEPVKFREATLYETDDKTAMCSITNAQAGKLMADLLKMGVTSVGD